MDSNKIYGIDCKVENCVYNKHGKECTAGNICVSSDCKCTENCDSTCCMTFKARS